MIRRLLTVTGFAVAMILGATASPPPPDRPLTSEALGVLTRVLEAEPSIKQIHAAEVLIAFDRAPQVYERLHREAGQHDETPIYRIVFWRALAASSPTAAERQTWLDKIFDVAATPGLPDRLHAIESVAKLGAAPPAELVPTLQTWARTAPERDAVFVAWALWPHHPPDDPADTLAQWLRSDDNVTRLRAAYIMRWLEPNSTRAQKALRYAADHVSERDVTAAIIVASAHLLQPSADAAPQWRRQLETMINGNDPAVIYHALQGLMTYYTTADLDPITALLKHADPDVRVAAAWTILMIESRSDASADV